MANHINNRNGKGIYNRQDWLKESDKLYRSAMMLRSEGERNRAILNQMNSSDEQPIDTISIISSTNKSSRLLLGYAFEMLLKSGVLLLNYGASPETLQNIFKSEYGHNLYKMCKALGIILTKREADLINLAEKDLLIQARYPVAPLDNSDDSYLEMVNELDKSFADEVLFSELTRLYQEIKGIIVSFDKDKSNCASFNCINFDGDGVLFLRSGGNLPPRAIVRFSTKQKKLGITTKDKLEEQIKEMIERGVKLARIYLYGWSEYEFFEDTGKKLVLMN